MKKSLRKLALCKETIRALSGADIRHVMGGQDAVAALVVEQSGDRQCPALAVK